MSRAILRRLLTHGYFPRELPPTFTTGSFGSRVIQNWRSRPNGFGNGQKPSRSIRHNLARSGLLRRQLEIPNPISYAGLCTEIASAWKDIESKICRSSISFSQPVFHRSGARAFIPRIPRQTDLIPIRANIRAGSRLIFVTDITRFYHSIYSHSVPWVLHGKATAKKMRSYALVGNRIDRALRNCRDGQTIGVSIGPDASLIVAELILSEVDENLLVQMPYLRALRYVDDYELALESQDQAEDVVGILQAVLSGFELELNPRKTELHTLPVPHEYRWVSAIRSLPLRQISKAQSNDLVRLFDSAFEYAKDTPGEPVLRYLMGRLKGFKPLPESARIYQHLLLQCITVESGTILGAIGHIIDNAHSGANIDNQAIEQTINRFIEFHAPLGRHNEVAWAIWGIIVLKLNIHDKARKSLECIEDPAVVLLSLHAERRGRFSTAVDKSIWQRLMTAESLYGEHWLLAYEAFVRGWLPSADRKNYISADPYYRFIAGLGVRFYRERAVEDVKPSGIPPSMGIAPVFYV